MRSTTSISIKDTKILDSSIEKDSLMLSLFWNGIIKQKGDVIMFKEFGVTNLEVTKDDIYKNPSNPILRMYDDDELIGTFSIITGEVLENLDLAEYDIRFAQKQIELNRDNYLETWKDYVGLLHA